MPHKAEFHEDKYIILKRETLTLLTPVERNGLEKAILQLEVAMLKNKIPTDNKYYVCNRDEPYAPEVIRLILEGEYNKEHADE